MGLGKEKFRLHGICLASEAACVFQVDSDIDAGAGKMPKIGHRLHADPTKAIAGSRLARDVGDHGETKVLAHAIFGFEHGRVRAREITAGFARDSRLKLQRPVVDVGVVHLLIEARVRARHRGCRAQRG
ncbi:MAG: hypothetical protein JOZ27_06200 [Caulobacteraceae bacterium]|nr:hypothetical protein [Caulobacteraceae bacterium]